MSAMNVHDTHYILTLLYSSGVTRVVKLTIDGGREVRSRLADEGVPWLATTIMVRKPAVYSDPNDPPVEGINWARVDHFTLVPTAGGEA